MRKLVLACVIAALGFGALAGAAQAVPADYTLTVNKVGGGYVSGSGDNGAGETWSIDCGATCTDTIPDFCAFDPDIGMTICTPTDATVTAQNANGFAFVSWSGCDSVAGADCTVAGPANESVTATFADIQAPTAGLTAPTAGVKSGTIGLAASASDNAAVQRVDFFVRGVPQPSDSSAPYAISFDSTAVADGSAVVSARAFDTSGNQSSVSSVTITIDNDAPLLGDIAGPGAGPFASGSTQSFTWTVSDAGSGIKSVECKLDGGAFGACASDTSQSYSGLAAGSHTLTVRATDNIDRTTEKTATWSIQAPATNTSTTSTTSGGTTTQTTTTQTTQTSTGTGTPAGTPPPALQAIATKVSARWSVRKGKTRAKTLKLSAIPAGAKVKVTCKGRGCPFRSKAFKVVAGAVDLRKAFKKALPAGTTVTITVTRAGMSGEAIAFKTRRKASPKKTVRHIT